VPSTSGFEADVYEERITAANRLAWEYGEDDLLPVGGWLADIGGQYYGVRQPSLKGCAF
jgi:hypothetical protein